MQEMYKLEGTVLTVVLPQDVDHPVTDLVRRETDHIINQNYIRTIIFDFTHTEFMDSSGIGVLLSRYKQMEGSRGTVRIYGAGPRITRILTIGGIMRLVKKCDTREEAIYG